MIIEESALVRNMIAAVAQGTHIECNRKQYPGVRAALTVVAERKADLQDETLSLLAIQERERLDLLFNGAISGHSH